MNRTHSTGLIWAVNLQRPTNTILYENSNCKLVAQACYTLTQQPNKRRQLLIKIVFFSDTSTGFEMPQCVLDELLQPKR